MSDRGPGSGALSGLGDDADEGEQPCPGERTAEPPILAEQALLRRDVAAPLMRHALGREMALPPFEGRNESVAPGKGRLGSQAEQPAGEKEHDGREKQCEARKAAGGEEAHGEGGGGLGTAARRASLPDAPATAGSPGQLLCRSRHRPVGVDCGCSRGHHPDHRAGKGCHAKDNQQRATPALDERIQHSSPHLVLRTLDRIFAAMNLASL